MIELYPSRYGESPEFLEIQTALDAWSEKLWRDKEDFLRQFHVETATWGLDAWEEMLGILTHSGEDADRRERILSKLRRAGTTTKAVVKNIAEAFVTGEVVVTEYPGEARVVLSFQGKGVPKRIVDLTNVLDEVKPAHLVFEYVFQFITHRDLKVHTHGDLALYSHTQIREEEISLA